MRQQPSLGPLEPLLAAIARDFARGCDPAFAQDLARLAATEEILRIKIALEKRRCIGRLLAVCAAGRQAGGTDVAIERILADLKRLGIYANQAASASRVAQRQLARHRTARGKRALPAVQDNSPKNKLPRRAISPGAEPDCDRTRQGTAARPADREEGA